MLDCTNAPAACIAAGPIILCKVTAPVEICSRSYCERIVISVVNLVAVSS